MLDAPKPDDVPDFSKANCKGRPTEWWYPAEKQTRESNANTRNAIEVCRDCRIKLSCLMYSLKYEPNGIWGGYTEPQRHRIRLDKQIVCVRPVGGVRKSRKYVDVAD